MEAGRGIVRSAGLETEQPRAVCREEARQLGPATQHLVERGLEVAVGGVVYVRLVVLATDLNAITKCLVGKEEHTDN
jgi:hypothetical protein